MTNSFDKSSNRTPQTIDIVPTRPAGLGAPSTQRPSSPNPNYQQIFREAFAQSVDDGGNPGGIPGAGMAAPSSSYNPPKDYDDTVIAIHHSKRGFRLVLQANPKAFIIIAVIIIALLSRPGLGDVLAAVLKSIGTH